MEDLFTQQEKVKFMEMALEEAVKTGKQGNIPVGAIIVDENKQIILLEKLNGI